MKNTSTLQLALHSYIRDVNLNGKGIITSAINVVNSRDLEIITSIEVLYYPYYLGRGMNTDLLEIVHVRIMSSLVLKSATKRKTTQTFAHELELNNKNIFKKK